MSSQHKIGADNSFLVVPVTEAVERMAQCRTMNGQKITATDNAPLLRLSSEMLVFVAAMRFASKCAGTVAKAN